MTNYLKQLNTLIDDLTKDIIQQEKEQDIADNVLVEMKEELTDIRDRYLYVMEKR